MRREWAERVTVLSRHWCCLRQVQKAVNRLIAIWDDRKVFGLSGTKTFNELIAAAETPRKGGCMPILLQGCAMWTKTGS